MSLLATNKIDLSAAVTTFKVDKKKKEVVEKKDPNAIGFSKYSRENCDHILPLKMDINIDLKLQGKIINLHLEAPGTIAGKRVICILVLCNIVIYAVDYC